MLVMLVEYLVVKSKVVFTSRKLNLGFGPLERPARGERHADDRPEMSGELECGEIWVKVRSVA